MSATSSIAFISYSCVSLVLIVLGSIYLVKNQFMPYHSQALGLSWTELEANMQVLIVALMRAAGGGFLATGVAILLLLVFPWRAGDTWAVYAVPAITLCISLGALYATWLVKTRTPGTPPIRLSFIAVALTIIGFIFSVI